MTKHLIIAALSAALLPGCGGTDDTVLYGAPQVPVQGRISIPHATVALREVSLPTYATGEEISVADASGAIQEFPGSVWADDPVRAVTLRLTDVLGDVTRRTVASDPWPFQDNPDVVVDVRVEEFGAQTSGRFVARGRYYVAHDSPGRRDRARSFDLAKSFDPELGFPAIAEARSRVIAALAQTIARDGLR